MLKKLLHLLRRYNYRDSRTGKSVSKDYADRNESTTVRERRW